MENVENTINCLSTNTHVPYLSLLAKIPGIKLTVFSKRYEGRDWQKEYRNLPSNVLHVPIDNPAINDLYLSFALNHSKIILHCHQDLQMFCNKQSQFYSKIQKIPKIYVFHNSANTEFGNMPMQERQKNIMELVQIFQENNIRPIFISKWKQETWQINGDVILPGIDREEFASGWTGRNTTMVSNNKVTDYSIRVCSNIEHRDFMNGYNQGNGLLQHIPQNNVVLGEGNDNTRQRLPQTIFGVSKSLDDYKQKLSQARFYLSCNNAQFEDWYNLSLLEAVALGCPVVQTYHNRQGLIPDFSKYFHIVSDDGSYLIDEMKKLFNDLDYAQYVADKQSKFLDKYFTLSNFITNWSLLLKG